jgi:2-polyprenyl-3-methyl-5-hydroxy-6-metoxy-1,4-benzoquinol methylase
MNSSLLKSIRKLDGRAPAWVRRGVRGLPGTQRLASNSHTRQSWTDEYLAGEWERLHSLEELGRYSILAGYVRHLGPRLKILDVGCGNGAMMEELRSQGHSYVGCDLALPAVQRAQATATDSDAFVIAQAKELPFRPRTFDAVICSEVLSYLPDVPAAVEAMIAVLAPDGHLLVSLFDAFGRPDSGCWKHVLSATNVVDMVTLTRLEGDSSSKDQRGDATRRVTWRIALLRPGRSTA